MKMKVRTCSTINMRLIAIAAISMIIVALFAGTAVSRNWDWDQNHDCVEAKKGDGNWGRYDYDGNFTENKYSSKDCCELLCKICPVYANTGRYQKTFNDLTVPGIGPILQITRTYNSQEWSSSLFGYSWTFNLGRKLIISRDKTGNKRIGVLLNAGEKNYYREDLDGTLKRITEYGADYELIKSGNDTYSIRYIDGTWYEIRSDGKISKIIDKNQNEMVFDYNVVGCLSRITNASGNYIDFILGANGKIASISDNFGRTVTYSYDDEGNLISVTDPMGNVSRYVYNDKNYMTQLIDSRGNNVETVSYDSHQPPRVSSFVEKGEVYTIVYFDDRTEKKDSKGNKWTYYFNESGVIQKVVDPLGNEKNQQLNKVNSTSVDWEEDLNGNRTTYTYDIDGNVATKTDPLGNTWTYSYIAGTDFLETEINPLGVVTKYEFDSSGNITAIIKDYGGSFENRTTYSYDDQGNQTSITDSLGNKTTYDYNLNGYLIRITDPLGNLTTKTYDFRGNLISESDALGNTNTYSYDLMNRLISITDALGDTTTYIYDANGNRISETDANGNTTTFTYDNWNRRIESNDAIGNITTYTYDSRDNLTSITDANGNTNFYNFDILNRMVQKTNALGGQTVYGYDAEGNILSVTDPCGQITTFRYDAIGRKIEETNAAGETTTYAYELADNLNVTKTTFPNGRVVTRKYKILGFQTDLSSLGYQTEISDNNGIISSYEYDQVGRLLNETDAIGNSTVYNYDSNGKVIKITDNLGNSTNYTYDTVGRIVAITDRNGNTIRYTYDAVGRKILSIDELGNTTTYSYDSVGNLVTIIDALGNTTVFNYDPLNRLIEEYYADGTKKVYNYDSVGNLSARTDQNGEVTSYFYDALNRLIQIRYPDNNDNLYVYDCIGNMLSADNSQATISFSYDPIYRLVQSVQNGKIVSYSYDSSSNIKSITYPGGISINEIRNLRGYLSEVQDESYQTIIQYSYDANNRVQNKTYMNGIIGNYIYDSNGWITEHTYRNDNSQILGFQYQFDNEGNRLFKRILHDISSSEQYGYDNRNRLTQFRKGILDTNGIITAPTTQISYNLDALGNWVTKTTDNVAQNRIHNNMNELIGVNETQLFYDNNGNLVDDGFLTYEYDYENRIIGVFRKSDNTIVGQYKYDALGRRVEKMISSMVISYYYDENRVIEEQKTGEIGAYYVYGNGIDEVVAMLKNDQIYYYHTDTLGSVVALTDIQGKIIEQYNYEPYGTPILLGSAIENPFLFSGRRFDKESNLQFNRNRYLDHSKGRWTSRDPRGYSEGMNLYEYVGSNPINYIDPYGDAKITMDISCTCFCGTSNSQIATKIDTAVKNAENKSVDNCIQVRFKYTKKGDKNLDTHNFNDNINLSNVTLKCDDTLSSYGSWSKKGTITIGKAACNRSLNDLVSGIIHEMVHDWANNRPPYDKKEYKVDSMTAQIPGYGEWTWLDEWVARYVQKDCFSYDPWKLP